MAKFDAFGTQLQIGDGGGPEVFTTVAQVRTIGGPSLSADTIDVSTHDSSGAWREFVAGLIDGGEVTFDVVFDPDLATHIALRTDLVARTNRNWKLIFPDATATQWAFTGYITSMEPNAPHDAELSASLTVKVNGAPTLA